MKQAKVLTQEEIKRVMATIAQSRHADRNRLVFQLSLLGGMRACEIASLQIGSVIDGYGKPKTEINLTEFMTKGHSSRTVVVSDKLQKEIARYIATLPTVDLTKPLIASQKSGKHFSANTIVQMFMAIYADAGVSGGSSHSGRRTFITTLADKSVSVKVLQHLAGHRSVQTTMRYIDLNENLLKSAVNLM